MNIQASFLVCQEKPSRWFFNLRHTLQFGIGLHHAVYMFNPAYYSLDNTEPEVLSSYLSRLVQNTFEDLEDSGCIKMNEDNVEPTMLGSIASQYYLSYMTVSMFGSNIGSDTSLEVVLHILSAASEYNAVPVRHNEGIRTA